MKFASIIVALCLCSTANSFQQHGGTNSPMKYRNNRPSSAREMKSVSSIESEERSGTGRRFEPTLNNNFNDRQITSLSVATLAELPDSADSTLALPQLSMPQMGSGNTEAIAKVLSASLLITGNTVGSSMFVLPEAVGGLGMMWGGTLFFGLYIYNLISGLLIADVAINLHESHGCELPSSFKDFVDEALKSEVAGTVMAGASLISNSCFLAFGTVHAGSLLANTFPGLGLDPIVGATAFTAMIAAFSLTQTNTGLASIANAAAMVLFTSFASLLLPSMAHISDPMGTLLAPGTNPAGFSTAMAAALPLILSSLTYQNIVPSITKLLDFDRAKSTVAIALGSFIPMAMYLAWCYAVLGGGLDNSMESGAGAAAFTAFSASALVGSCVAAVMSLCEEYESIIAGVVEDGEENCPVENRFSLPAVALSMAPPTAVALAFAKGGDLTGALHFNGAFITPFLYGLLPIILFQSVQNNEANDDNIPVSLSFPQVVLGAGTVGALGQEIFQDLTHLPNFLA